MKNKKLSFVELLQYYFESYLPITKGLSAKTITSYKATFRLLFEFLYTEKKIPSNKVTFNKLNGEVLVDFLNWIETERKCSISTRNQRLSAIAAFAEYAQYREFEDAVIFNNTVKRIPKKKAPKEGRSFFTREELKVLFDIPSDYSRIGLRDKTLLCFMYASGMRAQEVCDLQVGDIQFYDDRAGINVHGKGKKIRRIGIPKGSSDMLQRYIKYRGISDKPERHVFSSQTHEQMTVSCIEEIFEKYVIIAKNNHPNMFLKTYTPHSMRHTTATHMLESGVPLIVVKNFLGHVSVQTTQIYAEVTQDTMNKQLKAWNEKWFVKDEENETYKKKSIIPDFLN